MNEFGLPPLSSIQQSILAEQQQAQNLAIREESERLARIAQNATEYNHLRTELSAHLSNDIGIVLGALSLAKINPDVHMAWPGYRDGRDRRGLTRMGRIHGIIPGYAMLSYHVSDSDSNFPMPSTTTEILGTDRHRYTHSSRGRGAYRYQQWPLLQEFDPEGSTPLNFLTAEALAFKNKLAGLLVKHGVKIS